MKLDSKYFDMIRIQPRQTGEADVRPRAAVATCQWNGCSLPGHHKAPRGHKAEGEHYWFCREHIRQYNASYNYFEGMTEKEAEAYRHDAVYGHRPTWKMGSNSSSGGETSKRARRPSSDEARFGSGSAQSFYAWRARQARAEAKESRRQLKPMEKRSVEQLGLAGTPSKDEIKARFKELVKRHHPDSNGGDRASEEKLREIIQAYNYLKQVGLV